MNSKVLQNGFSIPELGMGTWGHGGRESRCLDNDDAGQIRALQAGIEAGFSLIDTAEFYAAGYAESLVGAAIRGWRRDRLFIVSKLWKTHLDRDNVFRAVTGSLQRLGVDYLDLYLYHQPSDAVPLAETIAALNELVAQGLVRHIGVSNFAVPRLRRAMAYSSCPIVVNQVQYNLVYREPELELLAFCQANDVMLQAWRPIRGILPGALTERLCRQYACTLPQLALAWLLAQPQVVTLCAMRDVRHLAENSAAAALRLTPADVELIRRDMPDRQYRSAVPLA